ncbi:MAG: site-2 protease family protein [Verrucomicrobium sp.]|nr:site-2 protease family protein [Verrucomicrobium sp.]
MLDHFYIFLMFIPLVSFHEAAHAWAAYRLGDDTAEQEGRLTLDPRSHIDLLGTIIIPALNILVLSGGLFGWGRPVPVDPLNLRRPRRDEILIALAGPLANLLVALLTCAVLTWLIPAHSPWQKLAYLFAYVSVFLSLLNLIPIPPFDGWTIVRNVFGFRSETLEQSGLWWTLGIMAVLLFTPAFSYLNLASDGILLALQHLCGAGRLAS